MITQMYDQWIGSFLSPLSLDQIAELPTVVGVSVAILGLSLVVLRRREGHLERSRLVAEESLFPMLSSIGISSAGDSGSTLRSGALEQTVDSGVLGGSLHGEGEAVRRSTFHSGLRIVDAQFAADPHAYLRKLLSSEAIALQELVTRANSLQLLTDSTAQRQTAACLELLRIAQQILKAASQRNATAELLLDDAEPRSLEAARSLLLGPLNLESRVGSTVSLKIESRGDWVTTTRSLLDEVEQEVRLEAVG